MHVAVYMSSFACRRAKRFDIVETVCVMDGLLLTLLARQELLPGDASERPNEMLPDLEAAMIEPVEIQHRSYAR